VTRLYPFAHRLGAFAIVAWLTQQLQIFGPVGTSLGQGGFVVHGRVDQQEADPTPTGQALFFHNSMQVLLGVVPFSFEANCFALRHIDRTDTRIGVVPSFSRSFRPLRVASIPMVACVSAALLTAPGRCVPRGIMPFGAWVSRFVEWSTELLRDATGAHKVIEPLVEGFVKS